MSFISFFSVSNLYQQQDQVCEKLAYGVALLFSYRAVVPLAN